MIYYNKSLFSRLNWNSLLFLSFCETHLTLWLLNEKLVRKKSHSKWLLTLLLLFESIFFFLFSFFFFCLFVFPHFLQRVALSLTPSFFCLHAIDTERKFKIFLSPFLYLGLLLSWHLMINTLESFAICQLLYMFWVFSCFFAHKTA